MTEYESETTKALRAARMIALIGAACTGGLALASARIHPDLPPWVIVIGLFTICFLVVALVWNERSSSNHRANLAAEERLEQQRAETEMIRAKRALLEAQRDHVEYKTRVLAAPADSRGPQTLPTLAEPTHLRIYQNGELVNVGDEDAEYDEEPDDERAQVAGPVYAAPQLTTETVDDKRVRIRRLAQEIWSTCRDCNPTQGNIKARIPMRPGGLLRSHQDITDALDDLAAAGRVTPQGGAGVTRYWLSVGTGQPIDYSARVRAREGA
jgi:hypothetical protein